MKLTSENYFSQEANKEYMSVSQFKDFNRCQAKALAVLNEEIEEKDKECFIEGHLFETLLAGDKDLFFMQHPEMIAQKGPTAGQLKANYKKVVIAANKIAEQNFLKEIIDKCEKQVILTGTIEGIKVKCCLDLFDKEERKIYDLKCMANFNEVWNKEQKCYLPWYSSFNYDLPLAVYQEIVRQNFGFTCDAYLIAATKEDIPDIQSLHLNNEQLEEKLKLFTDNIELYNNVKKGIFAPERCENCDYCKNTKKIINFEEVL